MSESRKYAKHVRNYSVASVFSLAAGLLSFPILTRLLPVEQYGLMSLLSATLTFAVAFGKLGMQRATLRFYNEVKHGGFPGVAERGFMATVVYAMAGLALVAMLLWLAGAALLPVDAWAGDGFRTLMFVTAVLVATKVLDSTFNNLLQAQERSGTLAVFSVGRRYVLLAATLGAVALVSPTALGFFGGTVLADVAALLVMAALYFRGGWPRWQDRSAPLLKAMLLFCVPMAGYEISGILIQMGDRYVLKATLDLAAVGLYSAAFNLSQQFETVVFVALVGAAVPMCLRLRESGGLQAVNDFLQGMTRTYVAVGVAAVAVLASVREEVIVILASERYLPAADLLPLILLGRFMDAYVHVAGLGLYLARRSVTTMFILLGGAALNLGLNLLVIPHFGILGAAAVHAGGITLMILVLTLASRHEGVHTGFFPALPGFLVAGGAAWLVSTQFTATSPWLTLPARGAIAGIVYLAVCWAVVPEARALFAALPAKLRRKG